VILFERNIELCSALRPRHGLLALITCTCVCVCEEEHALSTAVGWWWRWSVVVVVVVVALLVVVLLVGVGVSVGVVLVVVDNTHRRLAARRLNTHTYLALHEVLPVLGMAEAAR
jgi:hypothetical protein